VTRITKHERLFNNDYRIYMDDGYQAICGFCSTRYNVRKNLIGREREIDLIRCDDCKDKQMSRRSSRHLGVEK